MFNNIKHKRNKMNTPVSLIFDNDEYYQTYVSPFPVVYGTKEKIDGEIEYETPIEIQQPDFLVRLYLGSLTIVGLYILFRVLD